MVGTMSLKEAATSVLQIIDAGRYSVHGHEIDIADRQALVVDNTRLYTPEELQQLPAVAPPVAPDVRVVDGTTQQVAAELASPAVHVGLLNFASARNPGGGFLHGAKAQEEDLCRSSGLYRCLLQCPEYYEANRRHQSLLYTDHAIFSPFVPFFKTEGTGELLARPFFVSVITAPAPNSRPFLEVGPDSVDALESTFERRWRYVLRIARDQAVTHLLLGAWGCGAFGGDPAMAAATAYRAIRSEGGGFDEIVFAIPGSDRQSKINLAAFRSVFRVR
jgi:uncharacterized protein (TIGR02452 family)